MISPGTTVQGDRMRDKRHMTEQDPFQMSESASVVPGSDKGGSGINLMSSHMGSSFQASQNLSNLIWQLPYNERKSIIQK